MDQVINNILLENNFVCNFIIAEKEKKIFFSIKDVLKCCEYDPTSKNVINQTLSHLKKKNIVEIKDIKNLYPNLIYSTDGIDFEVNNIYISDNDIFYFLIYLKKGLEFKKCICGEIFNEIKKFYINQF